MAAYYFNYPNSTNGPTITWADVTQVTQTQFAQGTYANEPLTLITINTPQPKEQSWPINRAERRGRIEMQQAVAVRLLEPRRVNRSGKPSLFLRHHRVTAREPKAKLDQ